MAAFNYMVDVPNPGAAFVQSFEASRQQQVQQQRHQQMLNDLQNLRSDPSPQRFADFYLTHPEMKEQVDAYRSTLQDADKTAHLGGAQEALAYAQAGKHELAAEALKRRAEAARQSSRPDLAKQFDDVASMYSLSPEAGEFGLRLLYNNLDPTGYENVFGGNENKIADRIAELTPFVGGAENARRLVLAQEAAKGVVTTTGPAGTTYQRADEIFQLPAGQQPAAVAGTVAMAPAQTQPAMTVDQFIAMADVQGIGKAVGIIQRNNIPIRVASPAEARKLPAGTKILLPDGSEGVVP